MKKIIILSFFIFSCKKEEVKDVAPSIVYSSQTAPSVSAPIFEQEPCQKEMIHVSGNYCVKVKENCVDWMDDPSLPYARCRKYEKSEYVGAYKKMNFCIDKF